MIHKRINLKDKIFDVPDFPQKGIIFRDLTPLLLNPKYFAEAIRQMMAKIKNLKIDVVLGIDSRGFIFGPIIARELKIGFVPVRKVNKLLPRKTVAQEYKLEYGVDGVKIQADSIKPGQKVLIVDDLIATGGTALATAKLVEKLRGKVVALLFLNELTYLKPREKLKRYKVISLIKF
ncbi:adenine phosphoribosyltransferase [Candidatus Gottesmanbacteria bacterium]|nr:adenine phosphoribosyltransferase [Candidatus Gottesmanbacteria bacterium]MBI5465273.1 adenine phosphoribosyltransferase [Candidatus Gottesmanbacteria bacterium]